MLFTNYYIILNILVISNTNQLYYVYCWKMLNLGIQ